MNHKLRKGHSVVGRRRFLERTAMTTGATFLGETVGWNSTMGEIDNDQRDSRPITGIDPKNIVDEAKARDLDALSDAGLYRAACAIVSSPPQRGMTSFTLHAPLETMARYALIRLVDPTERALARMQIIASASVYAARVKPLSLPARGMPFPDLTAASAELSRTFDHADPNGMEALVLQIAAQFGTSSLLALLTPLALPTLTGASHSHIGLWLLLRHGEPADLADASLLRAAARALASDPKGRMKSFAGMAIAGTKALATTPGQIERDILAKLANPTRGKLGSQSIRGLVEAGEATGNPDTLFGDFIRHDLNRAQIDAAFRAILRVSAHSMLQDDPRQAKFGWTHCLTLPQSAFGLASLDTDRKLALAASLVWITAYRCILSNRTLDFDWRPDRVKTAGFREALHASPQIAAAHVWYAADDELPAIIRALATQASIRNDIHLVKYTRATLDMGSFDPLNQRLYLAAAAHLCALWIKESPHERILDHLLDGRSTP